MLVLAALGTAILDIDQGNWVGLPFDVLLVPCLVCFLFTVIKTTQFICLLDCWNSLWIYLLARN